MGCIIILDDNLYKKKSQALRRYNMKAYKELVFDVLPKLRKDGKADGQYSVELSSDNLFKKVYGPIELLFSVKNDVVVIEDLVPHDILLAGFMKDLPIYKGIPYDTDKDLFKINMMEEK